MLHVHTKHDLIAQTPADGISLSSRTGAGLQALRQALLQRAGWHALPEGVFIARERHVHALQRTRDHLQRTLHSATSARRRWNCWPKSCAWHTMRWARSPASSPRTTCWARSSAASA